MLMRRSIFDDQQIKLSSLEISMNVGGPPQSAANSGATPLSEAQDEALAEPLRGELKWRRIDPSMTVAVAPLLMKPLVPLCKSEKSKAHKSAVYYSECFLRGITPNDADQAALDVDSQYQKWWINKAYHEEEPIQDLLPENQLSDDVHESEGRKRRSTCTVSSDDSSQEPPKRRRRRGAVRDVIDDVTFELHRQRYHQKVTGSDHCTAVHETQTIETGSHTGMSIRCIPNLSSVTPQQIKDIRDEILYKLNHNGGVMEDPTIKAGVSILEMYYLSSDLDARRADTEMFPYDINGTWLTISRPTYTECKGKNEYGEFQYSIGRLSFDMFRPTNLQCSIQGIFNTVQMLDASKGELPFSMPRTIQKELGKSLVDGSVKGLRTYNIVVALTIEPGQTRSGRLADQAPSGEEKISKPIRGIMTNYGYILPDPSMPNRMSVWFTGGSLEVNDDEDLDEWKRIFGDDAPSRDLSEYARLLAAKVLLGATVSDHMEDNGTLSYTLKRPIGGHGSAFCDVLYMDDKLRIIKGHNGSLFAFHKVQSNHT